MNRRRQLKYMTVSEGQRRTFTITLGLSEGYGDNSITHHPSTADKVVSTWMQARSEESLLTIGGFFSEIKLHYTYHEGDKPQARHEPGLRFSGEVSIRRLSAVSDAEIEEALINLADALGAALGQKHVTVTYRERVWIREFHAG
ncbi:MAG TPA: hypothetical protein VFO38_04615 [Candidatus Saccharimonadales bacterium]|nr:hypothetical protein [Candidatus Saccharimonadales bacterium]